jgi:hypothetical protein
MPTTLIAALVATAFLGATLRAQQADAPKPPPAPPVTMTGCVSAKPAPSGQYTFAETDGIREYRLTGKGLRKFAGQRVELVGGGSPDKGGLAVKGGLWPPPSGGARGVAQDPSQAAIAIQQAGGGAGTLGVVPEFKVSKVRIVPGACE